MNLLTSILAHAEEPAPLVLPIWAFPLIAAVFFLVAGLVTYSFRDVANRHARPSSSAGGHGESAENGHGAGH